MFDLSLYVDAWHRCIQTAVRVCSRDICVLNRVAKHYHNILWWCTGNTLPNKCTKQPWFWTAAVKRLPEGLSCRLSMMKCNGLSVWHGKSPTRVHQLIHTMKKVWMTGAGSARPVVSIRMASNISFRLRSLFRMRIRSPRTACGTKKVTGWIHQVWQDGLIETKKVKVHLVANLYSYRVCTCRNYAGCSTTNTTCHAAIIMLQSGAW